MTLSSGRWRAWCASRYTAECLSKLSRLLLLSLVAPSLVLLLLLLPSLPLLLPLLLELPPLPPPLPILTPVRRSGVPAMRSHASHVRENSMGESSSV
jgi:membrane protein required for beta-lactamase induction